MAQKPLGKAGKKQQTKQQAANRHGKGLKVQKGKLKKAPKTSSAQQATKNNQEVSKLINKRIEEQTAAAATQNGLRLSLVKAEASKEGKAEKKSKLRGQPHK